jgi:uncharacterized protein YggE
MKRTITVTGSGRVVVVPDVADVRLGVSVTRPSVGEARQAAAETAARVLEVVTAAGVARADVRTATLQVQPEYEYTDRAPRLKGQQVIHQYVVTVRSLDTLGRVIDEALAAGATTLDGVAFRTADPASAEAAARAAAVADARSKAEALAAEAGVAVGDVVSIAEATSGGVPRPLLLKARAMAMAEAAPTPVEAGSDEVVVSIVATYAIA